MAKKRAKIIEDSDLEKILTYIDDNKRFPLRDKVAVLLSVKAGLRAKEIANLQWYAVEKSDGSLREYMELGSEVTKGGTERVVPINKHLAKALKQLRKSRPRDKYIVHSDAGPNKRTSGAMRKWFHYLYNSEIGLKGCSSHSGRRTAITKLARIHGNYDCSIVEVQRFAGHADLATTASYIEPSKNVRKLVDAI